MIRHRQIQPHQLEQGADQPLGLPQRLVKHCPQDQRCLDREIRVARLAARRGPRRRPPRGDRLFREPDRQRAALAQASLVDRPVRHLVAGSRDVVATVGIVFVRHAQTGRSGRGRLPIESRPQGQQRHPCTNAALKVNSRAGSRSSVDGLRFHSDQARATEVAVAAQVLNRMLDLGHPNSVRVA